MYVCVFFITLVLTGQLVEWNFRSGRLYTILHTLKSSSNSCAAIQICLDLPMSRFDSQSLENIWTAATGRSHCAFVVDNC